MRIVLDLSLLTLVTLASLTGCRIFSPAQPCGGDASCAAGERCVDELCSDLAAAPGAAIQRGAPDVAPDAAPDVADAVDAGAGLGVDADPGDDVDAGVGADLGTGTEVDAEVDAGVDAEVDAGVDAGGDGVVDAGPPLGVGFTARALWNDRGDLDLHVIRQDDAARYCRDPRRKPRDEGVVLAGSDRAEECGAAGGRRDCAYVACDEAGTFDVDWLGDGPAAPFTSIAEPVLLALDGESGDARNEGGPIEERIEIARAPVGRYLVAVAHPSPQQGDGPVCARVKLLRPGAGELFCRALDVDNFEWREVAEVIVGETTIDVVPLLPPASCDCP